MHRGAVRRARDEGRPHPGVSTARFARGRSAEGLKRKRFTFAPDAGAAAVVEELVQPRSSLARQALPQARSARRFASP